MCGYLSRLVLCCCMGLISLPAFAQGSTFGFTRESYEILVNTGANLSFRVDTRNGDLVSMRYLGNELQTSEAKGSQLASGLGHAQVDVRVVGNTIVVSARSGELVQYYMAHKGCDAIYLATYAPSLLPVGELRFVARLNVNELPIADNCSDSNVGTAIESKDVFLLPYGRTSSKFYSATPAKNDLLQGGAWARRRSIHVDGQSGAQFWGTGSMPPLTQFHRF